MTLRIVTVVTYNNIAKVIAALPRAAGDIAEDVAKLIRNDVESEMRQPKHGNIYHTPLGFHQASAPDEYPAVWTGRLISGLSTERHGTVTYVAEYERHAMFLEYGTPNMLPRPHFGPSADKFRSEFIRRMADLERRIP